MIEIQINGKTIQTEQHSRLIDVCDAENITIPRFCYHKDLSVSANCRMCLVEIEGNPKPQPACSTEVYAGMKVNTNNQKVKDSQKAVMEFLLINHPLDCPICDQGGECELQDVAMEYGTGESFFSEGKRVSQDSDIGALIATEMTRCIHCTRCVRFGDEIAGLSELGGLGRGEDMSIATFVEQSIDSELSGNMIDVCPVGALTSKPFAFSIRSWQMTNHNTIARHDLLGSNMGVQTFNNKVYRTTAKENPDINSSWISDRDRFSYTSLNNTNRLLEPHIKVEGIWKQVSWEIALDFAVKGLKNNIINNNQGSKFAALTSSTATLEELYLLNKFAHDIGGSCEYRLFSDNLATYSYLDSTIKISEIEQCKDIIIIGCNPRFDEPMLNYRIRKAALNGATIRSYTTNDNEYNYPLEQHIVKSSDFAEIIAHSGANANSLIVLGREIHASANITKINIAAQQTGAKILNITTTGNTISARKVGCISDGVMGKNTYMLFDLGREDLTNALQNSINNANFVISLNAFHNEFITEYADVIFPLAGLYETSGSFINIEESVQQFSACVQAPGNAKPGWKILKVLADLLELSGFDVVDNTQVGHKARACEKIIDVIKESAQQETTSVDNITNEVLQKSIYQTDEYTRNSKCLQDTTLGETYVD
jgi:NADH-quinone oxidoreductase subunit G